VKNALSIRAKEIGRMFAQTGQVPVSQVSDPPGLIDRFISVHQSGGRVRDLSANPGRDTVAPINVRRPMDLGSAPGLPESQTRWPVKGNRALTRHIMLKSLSEFRSRRGGKTIRVERALHPFVRMTFVGFGSTKRCTETSVDRKAGANYRPIDGSLSFFLIVSQKHEKTITAQ
jgi:hypothetical protein